MNATGIIFASDNEIKLNELTLQRTTASLPFGGRYRLIDFALSNFVNSNITRIGIITKNNYSSLMDHIRMGRDWDLNRKKGGIEIFPPFVVNTSKEVYRGKIEALYSILDFIRRGKDELVVIVNGNVAANIDMDQLEKYFYESGADILMPYYNGNPSSGKRITIETDDGGRVKDVAVSQSYSMDVKKIALGCYIMRRDLLVSLIDSAYSRNLMDFEKDILLRKVDSLDIRGYEIKYHAAIIDDVKTYFNESMKLLDKNIRDELFHGHGTIYTKVKDSSPTIYKAGAVVKNSLIADGCVIDGKVENSILFRGVKVGKGAEIVNSIVMEKGEVYPMAKLNYCITDKYVKVLENRNLSGYETYPIVIVKDKTV